MFTLPEDEYSTYDYETSDNISNTHTQPESDRLSPISQSQPERITGEPTLNPEEEASEPSQVSSGPEEAGHGLGTTHQDTVRPLTEEELCSGKPFDAFTELKNGSIFAFRGDARGTSGGGGAGGIDPRSIPFFTKPSQL